MRKKVLEQFNCFEMNIFRTKTCIPCKYTQFQSLVLTVVPLSLVTSAIPAILKNITNFIEIHTYNLEQFQLYGITLWTLLQFPLLNYIKQKTELTHMLWIISVIRGWFSSKCMQSYSPDFDSRKNFRKWIHQICDLVKQKLQ